MIEVIRCFQDSYKWASLLMITSILFLIYACKTELSQKETFERNGIVYSKYDQKPFTGIVVGSGYDGYRIQKCDYKKEYKNGKLHGASYYWYSNGALESIEPYKDGLLNGMVTRYYPNGNRKMKIHMVNGMRGGSEGELTWNSHGKLF